MEIEGDLEVPTRNKMSSKDEKNKKMKKEEKM